MADESNVEWSKWWLPSHPEHRIDGYLTFDEAEGAQLRLANDLPHVGASPPFPTATLYGETVGGEALTLVDPFVTNTHRRFGPSHSWHHLTVIASVLLRGAHVEDPEALTVDHAIVRFAGLREICRTEWPQDEKEPHGTFEPYVNPELWPGTRAVKVNRGVILFRHVLDGEDGKYRKWSEEQVEAVVTPGRKLTIDEFEDRWLRPLESLVLFAAGAPAPRQRFTLVHVDERGAETPIQVSASVPTLAPRVPDEYPKPLLPFAALLGKDTPLFRRWWKLYARLDLAADFLNTVLEGRMFDELKLTTRVSFLESYHRALQNQPIVPAAEHRKNVKAMLSEITDEQQRDHYRAGLARAGEQHTRERLAVLIERTAKALPESAEALSDEFTDSIVKTRNAYVHLDAGNAEPLKGLDLTYATAWLRAILQVNLLSDLGLGRRAGMLVFNYYDGGRQWPLTDYR